MRLKQYLLEYKGSYGEVRGKTTKDKGHTHDYWLERVTGDGTTSSDNGHLHQIRGMVVQPAKGHIHELKTVDEASDWVSEYTYRALLAKQLGIRTSGLEFIGKDAKGYYYNVLDKKSKHYKSTRFIKRMKS